MKYLILLITICWAISSQALTDWPAGPAPCNGTLQACVDGVSEGEVIRLNTNNLIFETITVFNQVSLVAGNGYQPQFGIGHGIEISAAANTERTIRIEGLTFNSGRISYHHFSGSVADVNLVIRHNQILDNNFESEAIRVINSSNNHVSLTIDYNHITYERSTSSSEPRGAINIRTGSASSTTLGTTDGRIYGNTLSAKGAASVGIGIFNYTDTTANLNIAGNEITGGADGGILIERPTGNGTSSVNIGNNAFYQLPDHSLNKGVRLNGLSGEIDADVVNNSMIGVYDGLYARESAGATVGVYFYNNLITRGGTPVNMNAGTQMTNDHNLFHANSFVDPDFVPGPAHITSNPLIMGLYNGRLRSDSPAIETGEGLALLTLGGTPLVDADGTNRFKKGNDSPGAQLIDIGAYEFGDVYFSHEASSGSSHISNLDHPNINGNSSLDDIHITSNYSPPGETGVYNNDHEGIYYSSGLWRIFNQGITDIAAGASFNVHQFGNITNTIEHTATDAASSSTLLDHSSLNNQPDRIVQVTQHWTGTYNPHPTGAFFFGTRWVINNFDLVNIPVGANFNIHSQPPSKSAWIHRVSAANKSGHITYLNNPLINGVACAELQVTQSGAEGVFNDAPIGVWFAGNSWTIYNQDISDMPENSAFYINVNPAQIAECTDLIFANGLD